MKLRIRGNSIRLRLLQAEVKALGQHEQIIETTRLGPTPEDTLTYGLGTHPTKEPVLTQWAGQSLLVTISEDLATDLVETQRVSICENILFDDAVLKVLIEKDFKCLTSRAGEDESDNFENPQETHLCGAN